VETRLLHDVLVNVLSSHGDIELIHCSVAPRAPLPTADGRVPDVLIMSSPDPDGDVRPLQLLHASPRCRVLTIRDDARISLLYEMRPHQTFLGELSHDALLAAVRGHAGTGAG
jgi:hypothetical protein